jgi:hypothetical protein
MDGLVGPDHCAGGGEDMAAAAMAAGEGIAEVVDIFCDLDKQVEKIYSIGKFMLPIPIWTRWHLG